MYFDPKVHADLLLYPYHGVDDATVGLDKRRPQFLGNDGSVIHDVGDQKDELDLSEVQIESQFVIR